MGPRSVVVLAAVLVVVSLGASVAQDLRIPDPAVFAKQELFRKWRIEERAVIERIKKADVDQTNYDVLHYDLGIEIDVEGEAIAGTVSLWAAARVPDPSSLVLDLFDGLAVSGVRESGSPAAFSHVDDLLAVSLERAYSVGDTIRIEVDYAGQPTGENDYLGDRALTFGKHGPTVSTRDQVVVYTISEPFFARAWWPCKDVPDDKATARLRVTVPDTLIVASNGVLEGEVALPGARKTYVWYESYPVATYLVSLAISNYEVFRDWYRRSETDSMEVAYFVYPEHLDAARTGFAGTVPMIEFFSSVFGPYPFVEEKYGMAEIGWSGAMEHQTCTSMGSWYVSREGGYDDVVAHELAHQWWGDLVTPAGWKDVWLNEGFATYSEALWFEHVDGFDAYRSWMVGMLPSKGFQGTVYDPDVLFGATVYRKGAWVLHMLRRVMGDASFFAALREYGSENRFGYKNATTADFQGVCEEFYGADLTWFFDEWVYGEGQPRYGVYWAQSAADDGNDVFLTLRQLEPDRVFRMPLDVRFTRTGGADTTVTVWNSLAVESYEFTFAVPVEALALDPDDWVLKSVEERELDAVTLEVYPNPFNGTVRLGFEVSAGGPVELDVFDAAGALVRRLGNEARTPGYHEVEWHGENGAGQVVASGVYFVRIRTGGSELVKKAVLVK